jgi:hypothetical protein
MLRLNKNAVKTPPYDYTIDIPSFDDSFNPSFHLSQRIVLLEHYFETSASDENETITIHGLKNKVELNGKEFR